MNIYIYNKKHNQRTYDQMIDWVYKPGGPLDIMPRTKENRIYIFTRKKCKKAILLYCFHTAGVLHIFMLYSLLGPGTSFYRKSKINIKRKPNYEIGWFYNWPMIISQTLCLPLYKRWLSVITINQIMFIFT